MSSSEWWRNRIRRYATDKGREMASDVYYTAWVVDTSDKVECMVESLYVVLTPGREGHHRKIRARAYVQAREYAAILSERGVFHDWHDCLAEARHVFETELVRV